MEGLLGVFVPSEIQCVGIPAVLEGKSVVLSSGSGSGRTLAYMLPLVQVHHPYLFILWLFSCQIVLDFIFVKFFLWVL